MNIDRKMFNEISLTTLVDALVELRRELLIRSGEHYIPHKELNEFSELEIADMANAVYSRIVESDIFIDLLTPKKDHDGKISRSHFTDLCRLFKALKAVGLVENDGFEQVFVFRPDQTLISPGDSDYPDESRGIKHE
jgi:hypothetical protein